MATWALPGAAAASSAPASATPALSAGPGRTDSRPPKQPPKKPPKQPPKRASGTAAERYAGHAAVAAFAADVAGRRGWDAGQLGRQLGEARRVESVRRLIMPPPAGTAKDWAAYRARFIEPSRIAAGLAFWRAQRRWLAAAETRWQVPAEFIVAIIGVETFYGRVTGRFRVLDALATLAFDFPPGRRDRSAFFREQLEEYLVWCRREGLPPGRTLGSYAGAIGLPQFMPGSINRWAVDFDGDGHIDLVGQPADVVGSVARYLAEHGWQPGLPTHHPVAVPVDTRDRATLLAPDILPSFSAGQMRALGAVLPATLADDTGPLALVELQNGPAAPSHVAGTANFYAITRYNWSAYYAMAVIDLAAELRQGWGDGG